LGKPVFDAYFCGMLYPKIALARWVVAYCKAYGIHRIVLSPGSRNAPLLLGFSQDPFFSCVQVVDERSAGFIALGMAQLSLQPVALVCTSGSALANYYPAVLEAHYSHIPLLVLSADRPPYMWERADGQTIVQHDFFKPHIRFSATLPMDDDALPNWYRERAQHPLPEDPQETVLAQKKLFDQAFASLVQDHGPVHLNLPFEEPLYATQLTTETVLVKADPPHSPKVAPESWELFLQDWQNSSRTMVLVGMDLSSQEHQSAMAWLAEHPGVLVVTENTSNLHHQYAIDAIDQLIGPMELSTQSSAWMAELQPDLLITWGGPVVSKKIKQFLRIHSPKQHWHVGSTPAFDTYFCGVHTLSISPKMLIERLADVPFGTGDYAQLWRQRYRAIAQAASAYRSTMAFSDFWVYHQFIHSLDKPYTIHWANSSVIRYAQLIDKPNYLRAYSNRGTSGIEGSSSTAVGGSLASEAPTILVTGDLSFFYDSNAWWNDILRPDFRILLVNNGGGGIFRILPQAIDMPGFTEHVETKHQRNAAALAAAYQIGYRSASDASEFLSACPAWLAPNERPQLLEVFTDPETNDQILKDYFTTLAKFIES